MKVKKGNSLADCNLRHKVRNNKRLLRRVIADYKKFSKCAVCGENHPSCLEFHHKDKLIKETEVSKMLTRYTEEEIFAEINKCVVLCSNCHRKIHWEEK